MIEPGTRINHFASNINWAPTLLDLAGVTIPTEVQGISLVPLWKKDRVEHWKDELYYHYYEYPEPHRVSPHFGIRTPRYKLIRFYGAENNWEFYDLETDPEEMHNAYGDGKYQSTIASMKKELGLLIDKYQDREAKEILDKGETPLK